MYISDFFLIMDLRKKSINGLFILVKIRDYSKVMREMEIKNNTVCHYIQNKSSVMSSCRGINKKTNVREACRQKYFVKSISVPFSSNWFEEKI